MEPESGSAVYAEQQTVMEYGVPSFVVSDQAWEQNFGENAPPAVTSEGQIYFRQTIPEKKRGMIAPHELTHAMRQADYAPYLEFVEKTPDMLNLNDPMTKLLLDYVAKHQNTSFSDTDPVRLYDEFNATIYGHISAGMSEMFESGGPAEGVFRDFQAYSSELSRIHELFKRENGADFFGNDQSPRLSRKGTEEARELAKVQEENDLLRERVDYWRGQTRRTKQITTDKKSVDRAARDLWAAYAGNKLPLDTKKEEPANNP